MLSPELRFTGFTSESFLRLLAMLRGSGASEGTLILVEDDAGAPCAALDPRSGSIDLEGYSGRQDLGALCERHGARRAIVLRRGAIEELTERVAARVVQQADYAAQWLTLLSATRELEREGSVYVHPPRAALPLPTPAVLRRALDLLLPDGHSFVATIWDEAEIWTAVVLRRKGGDIDLVAGPELVQDTVGPLGGDYRRDHRAISRAISAAVAPVHVGVYAQRTSLQRLLRDPKPGAWAKAITLREVIIDPAPTYVHVAAAADALRASARRTGELLGGVDLLTAFEPLARFAREQIAHVGSVTTLLGWNPLQVLAQRLRDRERLGPAD